MVKPPILQKELKRITKDIRHYEKIIRQNERDLATTKSYLEDVETLLPLAKTARVRGILRETYAELRAEIIESSTEIEFTKADLKSWVEDRQNCERQLADFKKAMKRA